MSYILATGTIYIRQSDSDIQYSLDQATWNAISWPATLAASSGTLEVIFTTDITITSSTIYFICGTSGIQFGSSSLNTDGTRPIITIDGVTNYGGLIENGGVASAGADSITVINLVVATANGSTISGYSGWLCRRYFSKAALSRIINCSSSGAISTYGGGLIGGNAAANAGDLTIINCNSSGDIDLYGGGIIGAYAGTGGNITCIRCSSTGSIGANAGGIIGGYANTTGAQYCYSTGIIGTSAGGIYGIAAGSVVAVATSCYSTGVMAGSAGGIFGSTANNGIASDCYSTGLMSISTAGGIFGPSFTTALAMNCYTTGAAVGSTGGIYAGSSSDNLHGTGNYSEANNSSSEWSDTRAASTLNNLGNNTWISTGINTPYLLKQMGHTVYSTTILDGSGALINTAAATLEISGSTTAAIPTGYSFSIVSGGNSTITIDGATGAITTTNAPTGVYTLVIIAEINPYNVIIFTLTVEDNREVPAPTRGLCCLSSTERKGANYELRADLIAGSLYIGEKITRPVRANFTSYADYIKTKKAAAFNRS